MNTKTVTAQNCSLFEIDAGLEEAFDQLQEEREITGTISNESRQRSVQLFADQLGSAISLGLPPPARMAVTGRQKLKKNFAFQPQDFATMRE